MKAKIANDKKRGEDTPSGRATGGKWGPVVLYGSATGKKWEGGGVMKWKGHWCM